MREEYYEALQAKDEPAARRALRDGYFALVCGVAQRLNPVLWVFSWLRRLLFAAI